MKTDENANSFHRRLFLQAASSATIAGGLATTVQAANQQDAGSQKQGRVRFLEGGIEYTTDATVHTDHIDRVGAYDIQPSEGRVVIHTNNGQAFQKNKNIIATSTFQAPPVAFIGSTLKRLPTRLNRALYHTESILLTGEASMPPARIRMSNNSVQAQLGNRKQGVGSGKEIRLIGKTAQVEVPAGEDHSGGHSGSADEAEQDGTSNRRKHKTASRTIEVQPELVVRNHGVVDVYTSETGGVS